MIKLYNFDELKPEEILNRDIRAEKNVEDVVDAIIADVRARGDDALKDYALKFDGAEIENLQVTQAEIDAEIALMAKVKAAYWDGIRNANTCLLYTSPSPRDTR